MSSTTAAATSADAEAVANRLLQIIGELLRETRAHGVSLNKPQLDSRLDRELGLDSLGRTELLLRLERSFGVSLPEEALAVATPRELLQLVRAASGNPEGAVITERRLQALEETQATPASATTLLEVLEWNAIAHPNRSYLYLYEKGEQPAQEVSYAALQQGAQAVAAGLWKRGLQTGQTVAIMLPTGRDYFFGFFGILLAGGIPVPIYPPTRPSQLEEHLRRHSRILRNAQASILITVPEAKTAARLLKSQTETLRHIVTVKRLAQTSGTWSSPPIQTQDIALLQYTSGSTGDPKGVVLTHANLLSNIRAMGTRVQARSTDVFVSWLPLYHDMGLIGACLGSLYYAMPLVVMSPLSFMARPSRWLWTIHRHRGTLSAAPNFAYELCLRHISDRSLEDLDLSSWRMTFNGAEPVSAETLKKFIDRFSRYGFRAEAMAPVYGLAEACVGLALQPPDRPPVIERIQRTTFMATRQALPANRDDPTALRFVACGQPLPDHQIRVVDEQGRELPERYEGRLEFQGPSCTSGYFRNPAATLRLYHGEWLDSGDRAYMAAGDVYITGRVKDVIIRGGRNIYPYELEQAVGEIPGIRHGNVVAFASSDPASGTERLVIVAEIRHTTPAVHASLQQQVHAVTVDLLGAPPDNVVLVPPRTVLKTSSGKLRRAAMRERYEHEQLGSTPKARWRQFARLSLTATGPQLRRLLHRGGALGYAGYAWALFAAVGLVVWTAVILLPRLNWRWAVVHGAARGLGGLAGTGLTVQGLEHLPSTTPCVLVANHASYLDSIVLAAALPRYFRFVAKRELMSHTVIRLPLRRLGTVFIERFDLQRSATEAQQIAELVRAGQPLAFFPEGTFYPLPGLLPFRMGAFVAAAQAGVPVIPVTICGTRAMLRSGSWLPHQAILRVVVEKPIFPEGNGWQAAVKLRDATRAVILQHSKEPDLAR